VPGWLGGRGPVVREQPEDAHGSADAPERTRGLAAVQEIGLDGAGDADDEGTGHNATSELLGDDTDDDLVLEANVAETVVYGIWTRVYRRLFCSGG